MSWGFRPEDLLKASLNKHSCEHCDQKDTCTIYRSLVLTKEASEKYAMSENT